jgi:hypothetical protein
MKTITYIANITYSGMTYITPLIVTYKHTGKRYVYKKPRDKYQTVTENKELALEKINQGLTVTEKKGYYYIDRIAIPTINAKGEKDIWYISNCGDSYTINKVSKYGKKIHEQLSQEQHENRT